MKKGSLILALLLSLTGCEDVVQIDAPSEAPRLSVDALIRVDVDEQFVPVEVKITLTDNFFGTVPVTNVESIVILKELLEDGFVVSSSSSSLAEVDPGSGIYVPDPNFSTDQRIRTSSLDQDILYTLVINHQDKRYVGQTKYVRTAPIDLLTQGEGTLFDEDDTEVIITFTDDPDVANFYVFDFGFGEYLVTEDEFYMGQQFEFSYFYDQQFDPGTELLISVLGADRTFYNYMDQLIEQGGDLQGPFQTPAATIRGNIFDVTDLDNINVFDNVDQPDVFPLGYFGIVQEYRDTIVIE
ncbi:MAG TPA: DUF4249 family protein [Eudoraea sp.]|nr:DUF4249 family protein [Eudoraea sp.]